MGILVEVPHKPPVLQKLSRIEAGLSDTGASLGQLSTRVEEL